MRRISWKKIGQVLIEKVDQYTKEYRGFVGGPENPVEACEDFIEWLHIHKDDPKKEAK